MSEVSFLALKYTRHINWEKIVQQLKNIGTNLNNRNVFQLDSMKRKIQKWKGITKFNILKRTHTYINKYALY